MLPPETYGIDKNPLRPPLRARLWKKEGCTWRQLPRPRRARCAVAFPMAGTYSKVFPTRRRPLARIGSCGHSLWSLGVVCGTHSHLVQSRPSCRIRRPWTYSSLRAGLPCGSIHARVLSRILGPKYRPCGTSGRWPNSEGRDETPGEDAALPWPDGRVIPNSIAEIRYLRLGGLSQWVMIRG